MCLCLLCFIVVDGAHQEKSGANCVIIFFGPLHHKNQYTDWHNKITTPWALALPGKIETFSLQFLT